MDPKLLERWKEQLAFVAFNEPELFDFTQNDFDRKAKFYKDLGLTHLLYSSPFHCRMSFHPYWDILLRAMGMFTKSIHKYGMKAVEHFSVVVPHHVNDNLVGSHGTRRMYASLPGLEALIKDDNGVIDGLRVSSFYQIDGSTGKYYICDLYKTPALCVNNPAYRRILFKHLEDIYALGVDGIMTDDVEKYILNACACEHCRALFRAKYGYDLPDPAHWKEFEGDYTNPQYIDWLHFRVDSNRDFQYAVNAHYESLGLGGMSRPNYVFGCLLNNASAYPFEAASALWTHTFAENCYGHKTGHHFFACEAVHRVAMGERTGAASLAMFYPHNPHETYFSFANSWCWGQAFLGSGTEENAEMSRPYRVFETARWDNLFACRKMSDLAFYFSTDTRDYTKNAEALYQRPMMAWMQAAYLSGLHMDMVFQGDTAEMMGKHRVIVASHIAMLSDAQLDTLRQYVEQGGRLIAIGPFSIFDESGRQRDAYRAFDLPIGIEALEPARRTVSLGGKTLPDASVEAYITDLGGGQAVLTDDDGHVLAVRKAYGAGEIIAMPSSLVGDWFQAAVLFYWLSPDEPGGPPMADAPDYVVEKLRDTAGAFLKAVVGDPTVKLRTENPDILGFSHINRMGTVNAIKVINIADTFLKEKRRYSDTEDIPAFHLEGAEKLAHPIEVDVAIVDGIAPKMATLSTPERLEETVALPVTQVDGRLRMTVPGGYVAGFALIELTR